VWSIDLAMAKKSSASSARGTLKSMTSEDIRNRQWTEAEKKAVRRIAAAQAAGDDAGDRLFGHSAAHPGATGPDGAPARRAAKGAGERSAGPEGDEWLRYSFERRGARDP